MNRLLAALTAAALCACGSASPASSPVPQLPGDGTDHTAKPADTAPADAPPADPWAGRTDLIEAPEPQPPQEVKLPPIRRFTLKNGLQVIVIERHDLPVVGMQLAVRAGEQDDMRDKRGLAQFAAAMLTKGTRKRSAEQIAEAVDFVGARLNAGASLEATTLSCSALTKHVDTCFDLLPDVAANPTFPAKEMDQVRDQLITAVRQRRDDAQQLAAAHFDNELWGDDHVRGWPITVNTIKAIERADLVSWHKTWFKPNNAVLVVAGDVDAGKLERRLAAAFRRWRKGKVAPHKLWAPRPIEGIRVRLVDKPDQTQSQIVVGHYGISHKDPDYYAVQVMNYVLGGGGFASRLMKVVRSEGGKTYGARSRFDSYLSRGAFTATTFTRSEETVNTIKLVLGELARMKAEGPTPEEVADAIANISGRWATAFESALDVAGAVLAAELHGFGDDYVRNYALRIGEVTPEAARQAAAAHLDPDNLVMVIVGAAKDVKPQLDAAGWKYTVVSADDPIAAYERAQLAGGGTVSAADRARAMKLIDAAIRAKGGAKRLAGIRSMTVEGDAKLQVQGQTISGKVKRVWRAPESLRLDLTLNTPMGTFDVITVVHDGKGWSKQPGPGGGQVKELEAGALAEAKKQMWRDAEFILLRAKEDGAVVRPLGEQTVDGKTYDAVQLTGKNGHTVKLFFDRKTHLLARMTYQEGGEEAVEAFSDYKKVAGIQIAHTRHSESPQGSFDTQLSSVKINEKIPDSAFAKPQ
ncbi:MAG: hypothetical protein D6689_00830 [Deltaproteobacteria bacterium]|nr:MAG: hypothetical protein D6689_00830 [Deltaproteobacteria bacterium]